MALTYKRFEAPIDGLADHTVEALGELGERVPDSRELTLIGPFPVYELDPSRLIGKSRKLRNRMAGWRGLVLSGKDPIATVDLEPPGNMQTAAVRGRDSAEALSKALQVAAQFASSDSGSWQVRIAQMPRLFVTAVWLHGKRTAYIPTRNGEAGRPTPGVLKESEFLRLLELRLAQAVGSSRRPDNVLRKKNDRSLSSANDPPDVFRG